MSKQNICTFVIKALARLTYCMPANAVRSQWFAYKYFIAPHLKWKDIDETPELPSAKLSSTVRTNKTVWIYWAQGEENAPLIVKHCINSVRKNMPDYDVIVLRKETLSSYIFMPEYITEKYNRGIIAQAQFSDLLRIHLLATYGGMWCDATCYMTSAVPQVIANSPFFMFKSSMLYEWCSPIQGSIWCLIALKHNVLAVKIRNFMFQYWKHHNVMVHYFIFHLAVGLLTRKDEKCKEIFENIPYVCNAQPHIMQMSLSRTFNEEMWRFISGSCFIHKLTYKYDKSLESSKEQNVLQHILRTEL